MTGSAAASAAVRRALAPNISPGGERIGLPARDTKPTTRASLAALGAGALASQSSHEPVRANLDPRDSSEDFAEDHRNAERGIRSAEWRGAQPPRLRFGAPSCRPFRQNASDTGSPLATRSQ